MEDSKNQSGTVATPRAAESLPRTAPRRATRRPTMTPTSAPQPIPDAATLGISTDIPEEDSAALSAKSGESTLSQAETAERAAVHHGSSSSPKQNRPSAQTVMPQTKTDSVKERPHAEKKADAKPVEKREKASAAMSGTPAVGASKRQSTRKTQKKNSRVRTAVRIVLRTLLVLFTLIALLVLGLCMVCNLVFNGPSETARDILTMSMVESSGMKWVPGLFIGEETVEQIKEKKSAELPAEQSDPSQITIQQGAISGSAADAWKDCPDGIRIETVSGDTYNAYVMLIRDPSQVYLATSSSKYSKDVPGTRITKQIETEGAIAAINAGAFFDNGTSSSVVGSVPCGLVIADGKVMWDDGSSYDGFAGFTEDNILVVAKTMTSARAKELNIRDGCCFGPVLIMNGTVNEEAYNTNSGYNPRTAIGQRADGSVIFLCVDGRQAGSLGATYADIIDIMVEYGAVNACNLDGGSSTVMLYRDTYGKYGDAGEVCMINNYSLLQEEPRRMPTFFMVKPASSED